MNLNENIKWILKHGRQKIYFVDKQIHLPPLRIIRKDQGFYEIKMEHEKDVEDRHFCGRGKSSSSTNH